MIGKREDGSAVLEWDGRKSKSLREKGAVRRLVSGVHTRTPTNAHTHSHAQSERERERRSKSKR